MESADAAGSAPHNLQRRPLLTLLAGSLLAATAVTVLFVLPIEFGLDLTGFGQISGLSRLAEPAREAVLPTDGKVADAGAVASRSFARSFRSDRIDIPLRTADAGPAGSELEYKVRMGEGDVLIYSWTVSGLADPEEFYSDFHGEAPAETGAAKPKVVSYREGTGAESHGLLVAPMAGVHGWYLQNQSGGNVVVHLKLSGFYDLIPPGGYGNEAKLEPRPYTD